MEYYQFGLIGYPLSHSLSPALHQAAFKSVNLKGAYTLYPIPLLPDGEKELGSLIQRLRSGEIHGLNVTIPHKTNVIPYVDEITSTAKGIGAVNTLLMKNGRLIGDNTDVPGFQKDVEFRLGIAFKKSGRALVLGAGGSARAVVFTLVRSGWQVIIAARRVFQAEQLLKLFNNELNLPKDRIKTAVLGDISLQHLEPDLIVNTTPLGMYPEVNTMPWNVGAPLPANAVVYDLVYNPQDTLLVRTAQEQGIKAVSGLGMLAEQGALSFEIWTGRNPSREMIMTALKTHFANRK